MRILAIENNCGEKALSIIDCSDGVKASRFKKKGSMTALCHAIGASPLAVQERKARSRGAFLDRFYVPGYSPFCHSYEFSIRQQLQPSSQPHNSRLFSSVCSIRYIFLRTFQSGLERGRFSFLICHRRKRDESRSLLSRSEAGVSGGRG